ISAYAWSCARGCTMRLTMSDALGKLAQLQRHHSRPAKDFSIFQSVKSAADEASKAHRKLGAMAELWEQFVPRELAAHTALTGLTRGVLHGQVDSAAASFELDRLLRGGLTDDLRKSFRGTLVRVKTRVGPLE